MGKPGARSILYRLIEAGQLARRASLAPLAARGLEPGDDAVLFLLEGRTPTEVADLGAALGLLPDQLDGRLARLAGLGLLDLPTNGGVVLTDRGERARENLAGKWSTLEKVLIDDLGRKERKALRRTLGRFADALRP